MGLLYSHYSANPTTNVNVNAVSGTLTKTFRKSYFITCEFNSYLAYGLFDDDSPNLGEKGDYGYVKGRKIVVLQIMLCGDEKILVEVIDKEDYDEMFGIEEIRMEGE